MAAEAGAPQQLRVDYQTILGWLGVESREQIGREHHEQFARGFEAYLAEGKAPTQSLRRAFAKFRAWLIAIYRSLTDLDVQLSDDVRRVFDRLIATDAQIEAQQAQHQHQPLFDNLEQAEAAGWTADEYQQYQRAVEDARREAEEELQSQLVAEVTREQRQWWRDQRARVRAEVETEVNAQPVYQALALLQRGTQPDGSPLPEGVMPFKLMRQSIVETMGEKFLKRLPRPYVYAREGGVHIDVAAEQLGWNTGPELVLALSNARPRRELIEAPGNWPRSDLTHCDPGCLIPARRPCSSDLPARWLKRWPSTSSILRASGTRPSTFRKPGAISCVGQQHVR